MITEEMLNGQSELTSLTPEQRAAIIALSTNDENTVIAKKTGEIYRLMDEKIKSVTGIDRNGDEKTYDYLHRAAKSLADRCTDYDTIKAQVTSLTAQKAELEDKIAKGEGNKVLQDQLTAVKAELQTTKDQFNTLKTEKDAADARYNKQLLAIRVDSEVSKAREGMKFKAGMSENAINNLIGIVVDRIKGYSPKFEGEAGKEVVRYYDENGVIMNNPDNKLNPFTTKELLLKGLKDFDILETDPGRGAGAGGNKPQGGSGIVSATNQVEAMDAIEKVLLNKGLVRGSEDFQAELQRMWDENKCDSLPTGY